MKLRKTLALLLNCLMRFLKTFKQLLVIRILPEFVLQMLHMRLLPLETLFTLEKTSLLAVVFSTHRHVLQDHVLQDARWGKPDGSWHVQCLSREMTVFVVVRHMLGSVFVIVWAG